MMKKVVFGMMFGLLGLIGCATRTLEDPFDSSRFDFTQIDAARPLENVVKLEWVPQSAEQKGVVPGSLLLLRVRVPYAYSVALLKSGRPDLEAEWKGQKLRFFVSAQESTLVDAASSSSFSEAGSDVNTAGTLPPPSSPSFENAPLSASPPDLIALEPVAFNSAQVFDSILAVPFETPLGVTEVEFKFGLSVMRKSFRVVEGEFTSEQIRVDHRRVEPKRPQDLARIHAEQAELASLYRRTYFTDKKYWNSSFRLPISDIFTSAYGTKRVYNGVMKSFHPGLDIRAAMNTPVFPSAAGKVVLAKNLFFTGNTIIIDHGYGVLTIYCHLNHFGVKVGDVVDKYQQIALSGKTGRVTGPHLHWGAMVNAVKVNPLDLVGVFK